MQSSDLLKPSYSILDDLYTGKVACNVGDYILAFQNCTLLSEEDQNYIKF